MSEGYINTETKEPFWLDEAHRIEQASRDDDLQEALHLVRVALSMPATHGKHELVQHTKKMVELGLDATMLNFGLRLELRDDVEMAAGQYYLKTRY